MERYHTINLYKSKKILENLKSFLPEDLFKKANIFVERALNPSVQRAKYLYCVYRDLIVIGRKFDGKIKKEIDNLLNITLDGFDMNIFCKVLTQQEHFLIGSTILLKDICFKVPIIFYENPNIKAYKIKTLRNNFFVGYTTIGSHFCYEDNLKNKYYFILEDIGEKNRTINDPRLIDFEKLLNLMVNEPKNFEIASIDDIYQECKIQFKYSDKFKIYKDNK